ncbi:MAG: YozD family protein [Bacilli bacterium]
MNEDHVVIDTEEISSYLYESLIARGYVPSEEEVEDLADIVFDYLIGKCMIKEVHDEETD